ncbi:MAG: LysR family transcriptional regulator [Polyangia bacterium]
MDATIDQLRALVAVADTGSFSAAGRSLGRVQSAVSTAMANLEAQLGVALFDRATRVPTITDEGARVLAAARRVLVEVDALHQVASGLADGLEARVSLCVDALFPLPALVELCVGFAAAFPAVDLRVDTETLSAVAARVISGAATLGVTVPVGLPAGLGRHALSEIRMVPVAAPKHELGLRRGKLSSAALAACVQIVLSERSDEGVADQAVLSARTWRVGDLHTKHALLRAGLGWGNLPEHLVRDDLAKRRLVELSPAAWGKHEHLLSLSAIHQRSLVLGPAHRWVLQRLTVLCKRHTR